MKLPNTFLTYIRTLRWHLFGHDRRLSSADVRRQYDLRLLDELSARHHRPSDSSHAAAPTQPESPQ